MQNAHTPEPIPVADIDHHPIQPHHMSLEPTINFFPLPLNENVLPELITDNQDQSTNRQFFSHSPRRSNRPGRTSSYLQDFICQRVTTLFSYSNESAKKKETCISGNPYPLCYIVSYTHLTPQ